MNRIQWNLFSRQKGQSVYFNHPNTGSRLGRQGLFAGLFGRSRVLRLADQIGALQKRRNQTAPARKKMAYLRAEGYLLQDLMGEYIPFQ